MTPSRSKSPSRVFADTFKVDPSDEAAVKDAVGGQSLASIYSVYERLRGKSSAGSSQPSTTTPVSRRCASFSRWQSSGEESPTRHVSGIPSRNRSAMTFPTVLGYESKQKLLLLSGISVGVAAELLIHIIHDEDDDGCSNDSGVFEGKGGSRTRGIIMSDFQRNKSSQRVYMMSEEQAITTMHNRPKTYSSKNSSHVCIVQCAYPKTLGIVWKWSIYM